jgi:hypothetical protein
MSTLDAMADLLEARLAAAERELEKLEPAASARTAAEAQHDLAYAQCTM